MPKVLFVDDDERVLSAMARTFRKKYDLVTTDSAEGGLDAVRSQGPFAVVVSDLRMPRMNGIEFFEHLKVVSPDTVRVMLTGQADIDAAMSAVNKGSVFRFLTKPCPDDALEAAIEAALTQNRLITAEKELIKGTLRGSVKMLTEMLALVNPEAFGRSSRIKRLVLDLGVYLDVPDLWKLEIAAMLSQIGCVMLPEEALQRIYRGERLDPEHEQLYAMHPMLTRDLIINIPRLRDVASMIAYQEKRFDGGGFPQDKVKGEAVPLGARILKVALDLDILMSAGQSSTDALNEMWGRKGWYDERVLAALSYALGGEARQMSTSLVMTELRPGMIFAEEVRTRSGVLLFAKGHEVSQAVMQRLLTVAKDAPIAEPIRVYLPPEQGMS